MSSSIVFIDARVAAIDSLLTGLAEDVRVVTNRIEPLVNI